MVLAIRFGNRLTRRANRKALPESAPELLNTGGRGLARVPSMFETPIRSIWNFLLKRDRSVSC